MSQISRKTKCQDKSCTGTRITWHDGVAYGSGTNQDPFVTGAFWSCDKCGKVQTGMDPPAGGSASHQFGLPGLEPDGPPSEPAGDICICFGPPLDDCPIHGAE